MHAVYRPLPNALGYCNKAKARLKTKETEPMTEKMLTEEVRAGEGIVRVLEEAGIDMLSLIHI